MAIWFRLPGKGFVVSSWLPGTDSASNLGERDSCQCSSATTWPGSTSRALHDNVTGVVRSLGLCSLNVYFLRVFTFLSECITRKRPGTLYGGLPDEKAVKNDHDWSQGKFSVASKKAKRLWHWPCGPPCGWKCRSRKNTDSSRWTVEKSQPVAEGWTAMCSDNTREFCCLFYKQNFSIRMFSIND